MKRYIRSNLSLAEEVKEYGPEYFLPTRLNSKLPASAVYVLNASKLHNTVQNVSNEGGTIFELDDQLNIIGEIIPSDKSIRLLLNDEWSSRSDVIKYMENQMSLGHYFFVDFN